MTVGDISVNGILEATREKVEAFMCGRMVLFMKASGRTTCLMVMDASSTVMATCIRVNGELTQRMAEVWRPELMAHTMMVTGKRTDLKALASRVGLMALSMKVSTSLE